MLQISFFYNVGVLLLLTMYMGFLPIDVETVPFLTLGFFVVTILLSMYERKNISQFEMYTLFFMFLIVFAGFVSVFINGNQAYIYIFKYLIGPVCFLAAYREGRGISLLTLSVMVLLMVFYVVSAVLISEPLVGSILNINGRYLIGRFSILASEPSYYVFYFVLLIVLLDYIKSESYLTPGKLRFLLVLKALLCLMAFLSGSAYVYGMLAIYLICYAYYYTKGMLLYRFFLVFLLCLLFIVFLSFGGDTRFYHIINVLLGLVSGDTALNSVLYTQEVSGSTRFILSYMAFSIPFSVNVFGLGFGGFSENWSLLANLTSIDINAHGVLGLGRNFSPQTYLTSFVADAGLFAVFIMPFFFISNVRSRDLTRIGLVAKNYMLISVLIFMLFQCQISNPIPWLLAAYLKKKFYN